MLAYNSDDETRAQNANDHCGRMATPEEMPMGIKRITTGLSPSGVERNGLPKERPRPRKAEMLVFNRQRTNNAAEEHIHTSNNEPESRIRCHHSTLKKT